MGEIIIRDTRKKEKFVIDDEYLNGYAKLCGSNATLVYLCLCRHADYHTQSCFPSVETMADKLSISRDSVMRGLKSLVGWNIIIKERTRNPKNAKWVNNSYTLLDKSMWKEKPSSTQQHGEPSSKIDQSHVANQGVSHIAVSDCKVSHRKVTHNNSEHSSQEDLSKKQMKKDIDQLIEKFQLLNASVSYGNKTQRAACQKLIETHGLEKIIKIVETILPKTNARPRFEFPYVDTPHGLWTNWTKIGNGIAMQKQQKEIKKPIIHKR